MILLEKWWWRRYTGGRGWESEREVFVFVRKWKRKQVGPCWLAKRVRVWDDTVWWGNKRGRWVICVSQKKSNHILFFSFFLMLWCYIVCFELNGGSTTWKRKKDYQRCPWWNQPRSFWQLSRYFSQGLKYEKWMNSYAYLGLIRLGPFYREFGVDLLVRCHYHRGRCVDLMRRVEQISGNSPHVLE